MQQANFHSVELLGSIEYDDYWDSFYRVAAEENNFASDSLSILIAFKGDFPSRPTEPTTIHSFTGVTLYQTPTYPIPEAAKITLDIMFHTDCVATDTPNPDYPFDYVQKNTEYRIIDGVKTQLAGGNLRYPNVESRLYFGEFTAHIDEGFPSHSLIGECILRIRSSKDTVFNSDSPWENGHSFDIRLYALNYEIAACKDVENQVTSLTILNTLSSGNGTRQKIKFKTRSQNTPIDITNAEVISNPHLFRAPDHSLIVAFRRWPQMDFSSYRVLDEPESDAGFLQETVIFNSPEYRQFSLIQLGSGQLACAAVGYFPDKVRVKFKRTDENGHWPSDENALLVWEKPTFFPALGLELMEMDDTELRIYMPFDYGYCYKSTNGGADWTEFYGDLNQ